MSTRTIQTAYKLDAAVGEIMQKHLSLSVGASSVVRDVIDGIESMIGEGTLMPAERLIEADLSSKFKVGRAPIREALRILAGDGVLELVVNRGARVRRLSKKEIKDRSMALSAIYCAGIELFVQQFGDPYEQGILLLRHLANKIQALDEAEHPASFMFLITEYHVTINHFSGNEFLNTLVARLHVRHFQRQLAATMNWRFLVGSGSRYRSITDALEARNAAKAVKLTRAIELVLTQQLT